MNHANTLTVADCEAVQTSWFRARATGLGGQIWSDGELEWIDGPDGQNLMFPATMTVAGLERGVDDARRRGRRLVGVWLNTRTDARPLAQAGFERGWSPWWMVADLSRTEVVVDDRVELQRETSDYGGEHADYGHQLALCRTEPQRFWYAAAYDAEQGSFAGRAWSYLGEGAVAGIFDMEVWSPFRRRGLGRALLSAVCEAARGAGAESAVLNATPIGKQLYRACGFSQIGVGVTYWKHLA